MLKTGKRLTVTPVIYWKWRTEEDLQKLRAKDVEQALDLHIRGGEWVDHWPPPPAAFHNGCFSSSFIIYGKCVVIVTETGGQQTVVHLVEESVTFGRPKNAKWFWSRLTKLVSILKRGIKNLASFIGSRVFFYRRTNGY